MVKYLGLDIFPVKAANSNEMPTKVKWMQDGEYILSCIKACNISDIEGFLHFMHSACVENKYKSIKAELSTRLNNKVPNKLWRLRLKERQIRLRNICKIMGVDKIKNPQEKE